MLAIKKAQCIVSYALDLARCVLIGALARV